SAGPDRPRRRRGPPAAPRARAVPPRLERDPPRCRRRARGLGVGLRFCDASRVLKWFRSLFGRRPKREVSPIREADAYARSYGERSGEIVNVARIEPQRIPRRTGDMTGELLRRAFESKLDGRRKAAT